MKRKRMKIFIDCNNLSSFFLFKKFLLFALKKNEFFAHKNRIFSINIDESQNLNKLKYLHSYNNEQNRLSHWGQISDMNDKCTLA